MASLRKKNVFTPDDKTVRFLYLILKQLDLKSVNWQDVADNIGIKNGHAARMRWSRFKMHAEGTPPQTKTAKAKKDAEKNGKREQEDQGDHTNGRDEKRARFEHGQVSHGFPPYNGFPHPLPPYHMPMPIQMPYQMPMPPPIKNELSVKPEPGAEFRQMSSMPPGLPPPLHPWQAPPPLAPSMAPPKPFCSPFTFDDDEDDVPIKQLISPRKTTVSMADLRLNFPAVAQSDNATEVPLPVVKLETTSNSDPPDTDRPGSLLPPSSPPTSSLSKLPAPQPDTQPTPAPSEPVRQTAPVLPAVRPEPPVIPAQPTNWIPSSHGSLQSPAPPHYRPYPPDYRHPHPQQYQLPYGHHAPYPMDYIQRTMMQPFNTMGYLPNSASPFPQYPVSQQPRVTQKACPIMPFALQREASPSVQNIPAPHASSEITQDPAKEEVPASGGSGQDEAAEPAPSQEDQTTNEVAPRAQSIVLHAVKAEPVSPQLEVTKPVQAENSDVETQQKASPPETQEPGPSSSASNLVAAPNASATEAATPTPTERPAAVKQEQSPTPPPQLTVVAVEQQTVPPPMASPAPQPLQSVAFPPQIRGQSSAQYWPHPHLQTHYFPPHYPPIPYHLSPAPPPYAHPPPYPPPSHHYTPTISTPSFPPNLHTPTDLSDEDCAFDFDFDFSSIQDDLDISMGRIGMEPQFVITGDGEGAGQEESL